jgi:hypothetical protein
MFCSKCGNVMNDGDKFCTKCGFTIPQAGAAQPMPPPPPQPQYAPPPPQYAPPPQGYAVPQQGYGVPYGPPQYVPRKGTTLWQHVRQGDGENLVKTFYCGRLKSLLLWDMDADGFLSVTSKRLIYWSEDRKNGERTAVQSEMPLKDAAGVSFYKGKMFSWLHFVSMHLFNVMAMILAFVLLALIASASYDAMKVIALIMGFGCLGGAIFVYITNKRLTHLAVPILMNLSWLGFLTAVGSAALSAVFTGADGIRTLMYGPVMAFGALNGATGDGIAWAIFAVLTSLVYIFSIILYAVRPTFTLSIQSRVGGKGIHVAGLRLFGMGSFASKAVSTEPAEESEALAGKLGSMISELQESGDAAVEKLSK